VLHGWSTQTTKWAPLLKQLKSQGIKTKLLRIPGLTSPIDSPWDLNRYVDWFASQTKTHPHFSVIAHSFGGRIAIKFDIAHPNRIKKLVLIDSAGIRPASITAKVKRASFKAVAKIGKKITTKKSVRKFLYRLAGEQDYYKAHPHLAQTMTNVIEEDLRLSLRFVKAHTLIIWGSQDTTTPLSDGRLMHKTITGSSLKIIDNARHSPHFTHPDIVAAHIDQFLNSSK